MKSVAAGNATPVTFSVSTYTMITRLIPTTTPVRPLMSGAYERRSHARRSLISSSSINAPCIATIRRTAASDTMSVAT